MFAFAKRESKEEHVARKQQKIQIKAVFFVIWEFMISRISRATKNPLKRWNFNGLIADTGRDDRIRTCGLCVPNATLYQAEPHPVLSEHYYYSTAS